MARFYTNPFQLNAEPVVQVSVSEPIYEGIMCQADKAAYQSWSRQVTYSDGTVRTEEVRRERCPDGWLFNVGKGRAIVIGHSAPMQKRKYG